MNTGSRLRLRSAKMVRDGQELPAFAGIIHPHWSAAAVRKGFTVVGRAIDKDHLLLQCRTCGQRHAKRHSVVMGPTRVLCPHCLEQGPEMVAHAAGLRLLRRDPKDRNYGIYLAPCGHQVRRQFGLVERVARGECDVRCEICHAAREAEEARDRGWELIGPDPDGDVSYRLYRHTGCCHEQRIARANMQSGRFNCTNCGVCWATAPSQIYLFRFTVPKLGDLVKLGFSRDPDSRLHYQLRPAPEAAAEIARIVDMATGHAALREETTMHSLLRRTHPEAVVPKRLLRPWINVGSEVYRASVEPLIHDLLDQVEARSAA